LSVCLGHVKTSVTKDTKNEGIPRMREANIVIHTMVTLVTMGGDLQPGSLADHTIPNCMSHV